MSDDNMSVGNFFTAAKVVHFCHSSKELRAMMSAFRRAGLPALWHQAALSGLAWCTEKMGSRRCGIKKYH